MSRRRCHAEGCGKHFSGHANKKYCSRTCQERMAKRRYRQRKEVAVVPAKAIKRGDAYETLKATPEVVELLKKGEITQRAVAEAVGVAESTFSEVWATFLMDEAETTLSLDWEMSEQVQQWYALGNFDYDPDAETLDEFLDRAVEGFVRWRSTNFRLPTGPYITKLYHRVWIRSVLKAIYTGGRQMILSPPRHGKSELLVHFCAWLIARNPEFRIVWISKNETIAKVMVQAVKKILESGRLAELTLGPGVSWAPPGRNKTNWGITQFTVNNRDHAYTNKAPSMIAIGRGGSVLSLDVDLLVLDDIEDFDSTKNEQNRSATRNWMFNNVESRKEEHTAWLVIGSRQHPDDIYEYVLADDEWATIVDSAHDPECAIDPADFDAHIDCMLFPEIRSYRWLMSKLRSAQNQGLEANFEMVYLNDPRPVGMTVFSKDRIDAAKNPNRGLGIESFRTYVAELLDTDTVNVGYHLVAGLDPSATGYQASFLWAWVKELNRLFAIDLDNRQGGGIYAALDIFKRWHDAYGVKHWVWENNIMPEHELLMNPDVKAFVKAHDIFLEAHNTQGGNRNVPAIGVGAMAGMFEADPPMVDIPWGTEAARSKMILYTRQLEKFVETADAMSRVKRKSDILMASWFPMKPIRRFRKEHQAAAQPSEDFSFVGFSTTDWDTAPW